MRPSPAARSGRMRSPLLLLALGVALACDDDPTGNTGVRAIRISAAVTELRPGTFLQASADPVDASGRVVDGVKAKWRSLTPATLDVGEDGLMLGLAPGLGIARANVGSVSALLRIDLINPPIVTVALDVDTLRLLLPAGRATLRATARDSVGIGLIGPVLRWESSAARIAAVTTTGVVTAVAVGSTRITVTGDGRSASALVLVEAPSSATSPVITSLAPAVVLPGQTIVVNGSGFSATRSSNTVMIDGVAVPVSAASATQLTLAVPAGAAFPCQSVRTVALQIGTAGGIGVAPVVLRIANDLSLAVGQSAVISSSVEARCNELSPAVGRYVITVPNAARALGSQTIALALHGEATAAPAALAFDAGAVTIRIADAGAVKIRNAAASAAAQARRERAGDSRWAGFGVRGPRARAQSQLQSHLMMLEANRDVAAQARRALPEVRAQAAPTLQVPTAGTVVPVRIPALGQPNFCDKFTAIGARTVFVGERVVILEDTSSVVNGQTTLARQMDGTYATIGAELDVAGWAAVQAFGNPLVMDARLDDNGRVMIVFTPRMNQTLGGSILASVVNCDFFARAQFSASNVGEYLYAQVPTSLAAGMAAGTVTRWRQEIRATLVHELKHVTSFAEHIVRGRPLEESWLEEATARDAEEIYARNVYGVARSSNADFAATLACELRSGDPAFPACADAPRAMRLHFEALWEFLASPTARSPLGPVEFGDFSFYGSGWALTRWLVDQEGLAEPAFFTALTTSGQSGVANLEGRTGRTWDEMLPEWSLAMVTDDRAGLVTSSPRLRFQAWDLRSIFQGLCDVLGSCIAPPRVPSPFTRAYPVQFLTLEAGPFAAEFAEIVPGGFAAVELVVTAATARQLLELRGYRGAALPAGVRLAIMRVQ